MYLFDDEEEDKAIWQRCAQIISTPIKIINMNSDIIEIIHI
jgi:hypothetical protein